MKKTAAIFITLFISSFLLGNFAIATTDLSIETVDKFRASNQKNKKIQLKWKKIKNSNVNFYQIKVERQKKNSDYKYIKRVKTKGNFKKKYVKKLSAGSIYFFKIRACKTKSKCGPYSDRLQSNTTASDPVLKNLIIDIEPYNPETGMAGAFNFQNSYNEEKLFLEFGAVVDNGKVLPTFEYRTDIDASVYSPMKGIVTMSDYQDDTLDYEIAISTTLYVNDSVIVYIDHIKDLQVEEGDEVTAGQYLGKSGTWTSALGRVELMVTDENGYVCPFNYFDENLKTEYENKVWQHFEDWETFKYDNTIYDEVSMTYAAGCAYDVLTNDDL